MPPATQRGRPDQERVPVERREQVGPRVEGRVEGHAGERQQQGLVDVVGRECGRAGPPGQRRRGRRLGGDGIALGFPPLHHCEHAGHEGQDEQHGGSGQHHAEPSDQHALRAVALGEVPFLGRPALFRRPEEVALDGVEGGGGPVPPLEGPFQPDAAVQLAVRPGEAVPGVGRRREVVQQPQALDVVVEPAAQPRPGPGQRLVGDLDGAVVAGDQPRADQHLDQPLVLGVGARPSVGAPDCGPVDRAAPARRVAASGREAAGDAPSPTSAYNRSADCATAPWMPPEAR